MAIFRAGINALTFVGTSYTFSKSACGEAEAESKCRHLAEEKIQKAKDEWNLDRIKQLDFINKRLRQKNETKAYISNVDEVMVEYY